MYILEKHKSSLWLISPVPRLAAALVLSTKAEELDVLRLPLNPMLLEKGGCV